MIESFADVNFGVNFVVCIFALKELLDCLSKHVGFTPKADLFHI